MKVYDAHIHFLFKCRSEDIRHTVTFLEGIGLSGFVLIVIAEYPHDNETILKMIPKDYHRDVSRQILDKQRNPFPLLSQPSDMEIIMYLDARYIVNDIQQKIKMYKGMGFEGLKILYVPEEDVLFRVNGMEEAFGRTLKQSEAVTSLLVESASSQAMPILLHADLRKYSSFIIDIIKSFPQAKINIPHFGFSRSCMSKLLERFPNCYTDISSLMSFIRKEPTSYLKFIRKYQDQILFGSDALIGRAETVASTLRYFLGYLDEQELAEKIFEKNYLEFHKHYI